MDDDTREYLIEPWDNSYGSITLFIFFYIPFFVFGFLFLVLIPVFLQINERYTVEPGTIALVFIGLIVVTCLWMLSVWYFHVYCNKDKFGWNFVITKDMIVFNKVYEKVEFPIEELEEILVSAVVLGLGPISKCKFFFAGNKEFEIRFSSHIDFHSRHKLVNQIEEALKAFGLNYIAIFPKYTRRDPNGYLQNNWRFIFSKERLPLRLKRKADL